MKQPFEDDLGFDKCALCESSSELRASHIIPSFVYQWFKDTSATGYIRSSAVPNLRVQDGWKPKMLCGVCEQKFGGWEKSFVEKCYRPIVKGTTNQIRYQSWMLKFATSVSWRVLRAFKAIDGLACFPKQILDSADKALNQWAEFLLDKQPHPGCHEQHLFSVDTVGATTFPNTPSNINRYLLRAIEPYVAYTPTSAITYAKMGRFVLFGFIEITNPRSWKGTKLNANEGMFGVQDIRLPRNIGEFIMARARRTAEIGAEISDRQKSRIQETYMRDLDRAANSETFQAIYHDVQLFGDNAFETTQPGKKLKST